MTEVSRNNSQDNLTHWLISTQVDLQPLSREAAPKMLQMLELGMRKAGAGAGAAGLADSPLSRGPDARETLFGTWSAVHKSNCRGASPSLLNDGLHAIDATPAR